MDLLFRPEGQMVFGEFLKTEYSEENILFWLACEQYKKVPSISEMRSTANRIYSEFVQVDAPRQVQTLAQSELQKHQLTVSLKHVGRVVMACLTYRPLAGYMFERHHHQTNKIQCSFSLPVDFLSFFFSIRSTSTAEPERT